MTEPLLCLVCLFLLGWVVLLKSELAGLKRTGGGAAADDVKPKQAGGRNGGVRGTRSFSID